MLESGRKDVFRMGNEYIIFYLFILLQCSKYVRLCNCDVDTIITKFSKKKRFY